ncbi:MAG: hypothetical protein Q3961_00175 [Bifidobacteriaceae bacterium]|nr:hypothetical protein [Bifidobacteriaceae bacterium]
MNARSGISMLKDDDMPDTIQILNFFSLTSIIRLLLFVRRNIEISWNRAYYGKSSTVTRPTPHSTAIHGIWRNVPSILLNVIFQI